jgi:hypothetical protein
VTASYGSKSSPLVDDGVIFVEFKFEFMFNSLVQRSTSDILFTERSTGKDGGIVGFAAKRGSESYAVH